MSDAGRSGSQVRVVALGGGHGLHASLTALRLITTELTAVVTVADDGGSSGRIRRELNVLPPGDLRMALAALAGADPEHQEWAEVLQHRLGGEGVLAGHPVGNLMLTGLMERYPNPVEAIARLAALVGAVGRVLPMSPVPLDLVAEADRFDPDDLTRTRRIRGQSSIAATPGRIRSIRLMSPGAPACAAAVDAVREADVVVLGPGSWFTSVIPHLLLRELGRALADTAARRVVDAEPRAAGRRDRRIPALGPAAHTAGARRTVRWPAHRCGAWPTPMRFRTSRNCPATRARSARVSYCRSSPRTTSADRHDPRRLSEAYLQAFATSTSGEGG